MYDAYRCCTLPKMRMCARTSNIKSEYREEIYAALRGRSDIEDVRAVEMM